MEEICPDPPILKSEDGAVGDVWVDNLCPKKKRWTHSEKILWADLVKKHGRNYQAIADVIGTKTFYQCRKRGNWYSEQFRKGNPNTIDQ